MKCAVCGEELFRSPGELLPLCLVHEQEWLASQERTDAATAKWRFVERTKLGKGQPQPAAMALSITQAQEMVGTWADRVFPHRTIHTTLSKLVMEEVPEFLLSKANDPLEYADLLILILDAAHQKKIDAGAAVVAKHHVNTKRVWEQTDSGVYHSV